MGTPKTSTPKTSTPEASTTETSNAEERMPTEGGSYLRQPDGSLQKTQPGSIAEDPTTEEKGS